MAKREHSGTITLRWFEENGILSNCVLKMEECYKYIATHTHHTCADLESFSEGGVPTVIWVCRGEGGGVWGIFWVIL